MGPHYFFGLAWSEVGTIISIIVVLIGLFMWLSRVAITRPMESSIRSLMDTINRLTKNIERLGTRYDELDKRLDAQDIQLTKHSKDIKELYDLTERK